MYKLIENLTDNQIDDLYKAIELTDSDRLEDLIETLNDTYIQELNDTYIQDISTLKKQIKHCKNPMERKMLEKELNSAYKSRKRR